MSNKLSKLMISLLKYNKSYLNSLISKNKIIILHSNKENLPIKTNNNTITIISLIKIYYVNKFNQSIHFQKFIH